MSYFRLIALALPLLSVAWWVWAHIQLRALRHAWRWRLVLAAFVAGNLALFACVMGARRLGLRVVLPTAVVTECYVWFVVAVPAAIGIAVVHTLVQLLRAGLARVTRPAPAPQSAPEPGVQPVRSDAARSAIEPARPGSTAAPTRRQVLAGALVALPPLATALAQADALAQLDTFRIRHLDVELPALPPALDGLTIAHVSDIHVGRFTKGEILHEVVTRTSALHPDLVLFTGDLIDQSLDDLPAGLDMIRQLGPPERVLLCEGNHDLFANRDEFEQDVRQAGVRLLLNESAVLNLRGQDVQILGLRWGSWSDRRGPSLEEHMAAVLPLRRPTAFPILLAHHPHAFDQAAEAGIPLTLSGHTHGGQLMLTRNIGAGSLLFKYWSGLYRRGPAALLVSNGVGNWFPLRINAPAEILHLTLRASHTSA